MTLYDLASLIYSYTYGATLFTNRKATFMIQQCTLGYSYLPEMIRSVTPGQPPLRIKLDLHTIRKTTIHAAQHHLH